MVKKYEKDYNFSKYSSDIKPLAIYLPQYHEIPENNEWWGNGFTEWTNVKNGRPRYEGHHQPRVPDPSFGYYDLSDVNNIKKQVNLAKEHGIYGFAIYYYWFSGKRLLEKPLDIILDHKEIDIPFCLIWANENWTRTWDGLEKNILIAQKHTEQDPENFIRDIKKYVDDARYIRIDGKPVICIYAPTNIPEIRDVIKTYREEALRIGIGEIEIWVCMGDSNACYMGIEDIIDGQYEFPPRGKGDIEARAFPDNGEARSYQDLVQNMITFKTTSKIPLYRGVMLEWDNSARKKEHYHLWDNFSPDLFYIWCKFVIEYTRKMLPPDRSFFFINAWNEWGEGTYLEPDTTYGYANINKLSLALFEKSNMLEGLNSPKEIFLELYNRKCKAFSDFKIAVQVHVYYVDLIDEIIRYTNNIQNKFDLYISTDTFDKKNYILEQIHGKSKADNVFVDIFENKGRDVVPFIIQLKKNIYQYKYICHIHTKKSVHSDFGNIWREYSFQNLLGSKLTVNKILDMFESDQTVGIIYPTNIDIVRSWCHWGDNKEIAENLLYSLGYYIYLPNDIEFPAGNMFWARADAVTPIFKLELSEIPNEEGQKDGTIMHAIERMWVIISLINNYTAVTLRTCFDGRSIDIDSIQKQSYSHHVSPPVLTTHTIHIIRYLKYLILAKILFGKKRMYYEKKYEKLKHKVIIKF